MRGGERRATGRGAALRVAIAGDSVLQRAGLARVLETQSINVVLQAADTDELLAGLATARPHVVVRAAAAAPYGTLRGLPAAGHIRRAHPGIGVLVLSPTLDRAGLGRLDGAPDGIGCLLADRLTEVSQLTAAIRTVASGGTAIDPEVARLTHVL